MGERLVIIGADAAGMSAATMARRGRPDLEIIALEKGRDTSYSACGIPYVVSGDVADIDDLVVKTPQDLRDEFRIDVRTRHEVQAIDLDRRRLDVRAIDQSRTFSIDFDLLHIATGAVPIRPDLPGIDGPDIYGVQTLTDLRTLLEGLDAKRTKDVVVVGAGYIGIEMAEAFIERDARVVMVEAASQPMGSLGPHLGAKVAEAICRFGIDLRLGTKVEGFSTGKVHTDDGDLDADLVILGLGVRPNSKLALDAGIEAGAKDAVRVDHRQRTSADGVYSAGDCADARHIVSNQRVHIALGTVANRAGRVAGTNLGGGYATFPGVLGTAITRVCAVEIARTGLSAKEADDVGIEYVVGTVQSTTRAGYYPQAERLDAQVLVEKGSGRLIGGQVVGADRAGKRIDVVAAAITTRMTASEFVDLDLAYAPAISPLWEPFQIAARNAIKELAKD